MKRKNQIMSALPALQPVLIINKTSGEVLALEDLHQDLEHLITYVKTQSEAYYLAHKSEVLGACGAYTGVPQAEVFARRNEWNFPGDGLPREVKAKSRIERLTRYHLVQTVTSFVLNPNFQKREPGFGLSVNLGSVDTQMASLEREKDQLILSFKCWFTEYELYFNLPSYLTTRDIVKFSLPTVRWDKKKETWVFLFTILEQVVPRKEPVHFSGVDLGRVQPFTMVVTNPNGNRVADYVSSNRLNKLNQKRERLLIEKKHVLNKLNQYKNLNHNLAQQEVLQVEATRKRGKITRLGNTIAWHTANEITTKLKKHKVNTLNLENLKWAQGTKYGGKWNHSVQQKNITHSLSRIGISTQRVNPRNTSQECHKCGTKLVHSPKNRTVWCIECKTQLDRDYNAAMNIAMKQKTTHPTHTVRLGTFIGQTIDQNVEISSQGSVLMVLQE